MGKQAPQSGVIAGPRRQFAMVGALGQRVCVDPVSKLVMVQTALDDTPEVWRMADVGETVRVKIACRNLGFCTVRFGWKRGLRTVTASVGAGSLPDWRGEWMGTGMSFSHYDADMNPCFCARRASSSSARSSLGQDNEETRFLCTVARRPIAPAQAACCGGPSGPNFAAFCRNRRVRDKTG
jgi:hypothetical protein